jgi:hypothetical protein
MAWFKGVIWLIQCIQQSHNEVNEERMGSSLAF